VARRQGPRVQALSDPHAEPGPEVEPPSLNQVHSEGHIRAQAAPRFLERDALRRELQPKWQTDLPFDRGKGRTPHPPLASPGRMLDAQSPQALLVRHTSTQFHSYPILTRSSTREEANPPINACRNLAGSAPALAASTSASPIASIVNATMIWLATLQVCPSPLRPLWESHTRRRYPSATCGLSRRCGCAGTKYGLPPGGCAPWVCP